MKEDELKARKEALDRRKKSFTRLRAIYPELKALVDSRPASAPQRPLSEREYCLVMCCANFVCGDLEIERGDQKIKERN